jgi:drug/metabolite transporter (DMT)-like permease
VADGSGGAGVSRGSLARLGLLALIWGSSFLLIKIAVGGVSPTQLVVGRLVAGAGVLLVILTVTGGSLPRGRALWGHLALMSVVANIIPFFLFGWGEMRVTSGMAGILNGSTPLFTLAAALAALPEERWSAQRTAGLLLGFVGVVVVVGPWNTDGRVNAVSGQLACLAEAACYGIAFVYTRRFIAHRGIAPLSLSAAQLSVGAVLMVVATPLVAAQPMELSVGVAGSVIVLGAVGTGMAYLLYFRLISDVGATTASMVTYLIPIVAVFLGVVVQNDPLTWNIFVGAAVVFTGAALAEGRLPLRPAVEAPVAPSHQEL